VVADFASVVRALVHGHLLAGGFHQHDGSHWRRRINA
jgi:hypothetical protein